jgi:hypothetical protein
MKSQISDQRKTAYYTGMVLMIAGGLMFGSTFLIVAIQSGDNTQGASWGGELVTLAFGGMTLMIVGGIIRRIGARGLAGSGVVLDPEKARKDLEPYTRMAGGMVKDALDEADVHLGSKSEKVVMIKCTSCGQLNEESSKFCQECGKKL